MSGLCNVCRGSGHFLAWTAGKPEFWPCPCCGGAGARAMFGPAIWQRRAA